MRHAGNGAPRGMCPARQSGLLTAHRQQPAGNALKYEPAGRADTANAHTGKRKTRFSVQNFGSTIPEEDLPHVFDRFYRSDKSRKSESGSFGLGLAITKEMIEKLGGEIAVSSSAEDGTVFQVTLCL